MRDWFGDQLKGNKNAINVSSVYKYVETINQKMIVKCHVNMVKFYI